MVEQAKERSRSVTCLSEDLPSPAATAVQAWKDVKGIKPLPFLKQVVTDMDDDVREWSSLMGYIGPSAYAFLLWGKYLPELFGTPLAGRETRPFVDHHVYRRLAAVHHLIDEHRCGAILKINGRSENCGVMSKTVTVLPFTHQHRPAAMWYGGTSDGASLPSGTLKSICGLTSVRWIDLGAGVPGVYADPIPTVH